MSDRELACISNYIATEQLANIPTYTVILCGAYVVNHTSATFTCLSHLLDDILQ